MAQQQQLQAPAARTSSASSARQQRLRRALSRRRAGRRHATANLFVTNNEPAGEQWLVLRPAKWNRHVQYAWRFDPCELGMQRQQQRTARRPRVQPDVSDEEYLATEDEREDDHEHAMSE